MIYLKNTILMDLFDFENLTLDAKAEYLWNNASFVSSINYYGQTVSLYSLKNFFVEVFIELDSNSITAIESLNLEEPRLKLYLNNINLEIKLNER